MRVTSNLFLLGVGAFGIVAVIYGWWSQFEPVGTVALALLTIMAAMIGFYLKVTLGKLEEDPADRPDAVIAEGAGDYGFFSPHSWWPLGLALGATFLFLGMAIGWWVFLVGVIVGALGLVGWTFEYFRGDVL